LTSIWLRNTPIGEQKIIGVSAGNRLPQLRRLKMRRLDISKWRYALMAEDGIVKFLGIEENGGVCGISVGETLVGQL
jgi:peroxiredoxin